MAFNTILSDEVLRDAVTKHFLADLKTNLMREAEAVVDKTVQELAGSVEIGVQYYLDYTRTGDYFDKHNVFVKIEDKRIKK